MPHNIKWLLYSRSMQIVGLGKTELGEIYAKAVLSYGVS